MFGGICGALLAHSSMSGGSYCFDKDSTDTGNDLWELFAWEVLMTWVFIMVVYAVMLPPGYGDVGPMVIGIALTGSIWAGWIRIVSRKLTVSCRRGTLWRCHESYPDHFAICCKYQF